jgi:PAS domain S-box-containing protein
MGLAVTSSGGEATTAPIPAPPALTNVSDIRNLKPEEAARRLPVRLQGVVTHIFDRHACFIQDHTAGIYTGNGVDFPDLTPGDVVLIEGVSGPGEYAPIVQPTLSRVVGHANLPPARPVTYQDLATGREDSQHIEVTGLVRAVYDPVPGFQVLEMTAGGGRLTVFPPRSLSQSEHDDLTKLVGSLVRVRGVCGTWFNRQRQLFGVRLLMSRLEDIEVVQPASPRSEEPMRPISSLLSFSPQASYNDRVRVLATVVMQQPGRALFVEDAHHGLHVQTRQPGILKPGDRVELIGFPAQGEYTPMLQDASWRKVGVEPETKATRLKPDAALAGLYDSQLVEIEGRLLDRTYNNNETVLLLQEDKTIFTAHLEMVGSGSALASLQNGSRLQITGVCRIEVGEDWRAGPDWRAKSCRILLRDPSDVVVLTLPPWWTLTRLLWAVGILVAVVAVSLTWAAMLRRKVGQQTGIIRRQLETEAALKVRYQELFENANDTVYTHDLSGVITSINQAGEYALGLDRAFIIHKNLLEFIAEEQRTAAGKWLDHILDGTAPGTVEWDFIRASGGRVRLEVCTRLIDREGRRVEVEGIARDVTERRRLENEISEISTREQRRIGHDLHDGVCQQLAGIAFLSQTLADKLEEQRRAEVAEAQKITELVNNANKQTRSVARGLFPVRLEENGLISALGELAESTGTFSNTRCEFHCNMPVAIRDIKVALHLYYIAQEAILNAIKHGKASRIEVRLTGGDDGCSLSVQDNGSGMESTSPHGSGMGIRIMKYRARMIGAELHLASRPGGGTEVTCRFICESHRKTAAEPHVAVPLPTG